MSKVLFVATVVKGHISKFHIPYLKMFQEAGWETAVAARNDYESSSDCKIPFCDTYYDVLFERSPFKIANIKAFLRLKEIVEQGEYDIIHCHTPVGAILTRLAAIKARKRGTKVFYTAHGFHFYKGAPLRNWLIYFPAEWLCAYFTDVLVTINQEDYALAKKHMKAKKVAYVPGVGINLEKFGNSSIDVAQKRNELNIPSDALIVLSVGELIKRKNHQLVIRAIAQMENKNIHYVLAGEGGEREQLLALSTQLGIQDRVHLLGYRTDINELVGASDIFCLPSIHEGLPVALMEAMARGMPCAVSRIRGNIDLIDEKGGTFFSVDSVQECESAILDLTNADRAQMRQHNTNVIRGYSLETVLEKMRNLYDLEKRNKDASI